MCKKRLTPVAVLTALGVRSGEGLGCRPDLDRPICLDCLAEGLHDAADVIEGMAERIMRQPSPR